MDLLRRGRAGHPRRSTAAAPRSSAQTWTAMELESSSSNATRTATRYQIATRATLLRDWDPRARALAAEGLCKVGPEANAAIGRLRETVEDDPDPTAKAEAKEALFRIDPVNYSHFGP